jgi:hypothetical protein
MVQRQEQSPEVAKATEQMTAVLRDFFTDDDIPRELVEFAICEAMRVLCAKQWPSRRILVHCRKLINRQAARVSGGDLGRKAWIDDQLTGWLLKCHDAS